ncbi:MAG: sensor histidine kinase [Vicingaceae bacterium]
MKRIISLLFFVVTSLYLQAQNLDSTLHSLSHLPDSSKIDSLVKIARSFAVDAQGKKALPFAKWSHQAAVKNGLKNRIAKTRFYLASAYMESHDYDSALFHYEKTLKELVGTPYEDWALHIYINITWVSQNTGDYKKALEVQLLALDYLEEKKDTLEAAWFMTDIGYSHDRMRAFEEAIRWHRKALKIFAEKQSEGAYHYVLSRIGMAYDDLAQYDSAFHYNLKALNYFEAEGDTFEVAEISSNIGNSYIKLEKWEKALAYTLRGHQFKKGQKRAASQVITESNLGLIYSKLGQFDEAEYHLRHAIQTSTTVKHRKALSEAYYSMYHLYQEKGNVDSVLHYFKLMDQLEDSIYQLERTKQMAEMQTRFETEKKEQQIALQAAEISEKESKLLARQRFILLMVVLLVALLIFGYLFYQRYKSKKEQELQKAIIREQQNGLDAVIEAQEEERKRISKDLHDGVGQQLSGLKMAFQKIANEIQIEIPEKKKELDSLSKVLEESADEVRSISHQMMPKALTELGLLAALEDMLSKSLKQVGLKYEFEHYGIEGRLSEKIEISVYRICQELINNIIKHSKAQKVAIQLFKNKGKLILIVEDNGVGIKSEDSDGHGLLNIKSRLNPLSGEVNFEPSPQSGTTATVRIPLD